MDVMDVGYAMGVCYMLYATCYMKWLTKRSFYDYLGRKENQRRGYIRRRENV